MNQDNERRMLIAFVLSSILLVVALYFMPRTQNNNTAKQQAETNQQAPATNATAAQALPAGQSISQILTGSTVKSTNLTLSFGNESVLNIDTFGGRVTDVSINGSWNRMGHAVTLLNPPINYFPGDSIFGSIEDMGGSTNRPVFNVISADTNKAVLAADVVINSNKITVIKTFSVLSNYSFSEEISLSNSSQHQADINFNGNALAVGASFAFSKPGAMNSGNILMAEYYDGKTLKRVLAPGIFQSLGFSPRQTNIIFADPEWITFSDNYFLVIMKAGARGINGKYILQQSSPTNLSYVFGIEVPALTLQPGETRNYSFSYYTGPKRESMTLSFDKTIGIFFAWPGAFNWFMKPIEIAMRFIMDFISRWVTNWGLVIILLALFIKLILSPLSIKAAVSIKRSALLQPRIKNLQEKYKDDAKTLNEKMAELYKKEGINPLGGCLPMLLQIPVFFALYRVLSTSVELRGASFLWIKDLTMPDTLITMNLPLLPHSFNLLPIIMTVVQIISMRLQTMRTPGGNSQQQTMNTFLLPVVFLFIFWSMPAGLVLYWTIQNFYTIAEQQFINLDRQIKIK